MGLDLFGTVCDTPKQDQISLELSATHLDKTGIIWDSLQLN